MSRRDAPRSAAGAEGAPPTAMRLRRTARRLRWFWQQRLGWAGGVAVVGLLAALLLAVWIRPGIEAERQALLRAKVTELSALAGRLPAAGSSPAASPSAPGGSAAMPNGDQDPRDRWLAEVPPMGQRTALLGKLLASIESQGLRLGEVAYRLEPQTQGLTKLVVTQSVDGSYLQLRRAIGRVMAQLPHAGLDRIEIERPASGQTGLQARLQWSLYFRGGPP